MTTIMLKTAYALLALTPAVLVGVGVGWFVHPGAGLAAGGLVVWLDDLLPDSSADQEA